MGWNSQNNFVVLIIQAGTGFSGLFVYSPAPGAGNLIASVAAQAGTDPYGNAYQAGITSYQGTAAIAQLFGGAFQTGPLPSAGGAIASVQGTINSGELAGTSGLSNAGDTAAFWSLVSSVEGGPGMLVGSGATSFVKNLPGSVLELAGRLGLTGSTAPGTPPAGDVYVFADSTGGVLRAKGSSGAGVILYGNDGLNSMGALGFQNNWTNGPAGNVTSQYRQWYGNEVELIGSLTVPAGFAAGQIIVNLPAAYRPANGPQVIPGFDQTTHNAIEFRLGSAGNFIFGGPAASTAAGNVINFHGTVSLDA